VARFAALGLSLVYFIYAWCQYKEVKREEDERKYQDDVPVQEDWENTKPMVYEAD
jgi:hypothetical protein